MLVPDSKVEEVSISSTMTQQITQLKQTVRNANAANSMIQLAESASAQIALSLKKMLSLAEQSSDPLLTPSDRADLDDEFQALIVGIAQITRNTQWQEKQLLDGKSYPHGIKFQLDGLPSDGVELFFGDLTHTSIASLFGTALSALNIAGADTSVKWQQRDTSLPLEHADDDFTLAALSSDAATIAAFVRKASEPEKPVRVRVFDWVDTKWLQRGGDLYTNETLQSACHYAIIDASLNSAGSSLGIAERRYERSGSHSWWVGVFDWDGTLWLQRGEALSDVETGIDVTSVQLSSDGSTLIIGCRPLDYTLEEPDQSKIFDWDGVQWVQRGNDLPGGATGQQTLTIMSSFGNTLAMLTTAPTIAIYILNWNGADWIQQGAEIPINLTGEFGCVMAISADGQTLAFRTLGRNNQGDNFDTVTVVRWNGDHWQVLGEIINAGVAGSTSDAIALSSDGDTVSYAVLADNEQQLHVCCHDWGGDSWVQRTPQISVNIASDTSELCLMLSAHGTQAALSSARDTDASVLKIVLYEHALETQRVIAALKVAIESVNHHTAQHTVAIKKLDAISQDLTDTVITTESVTNRLLSMSDASKTTEITRTQITEQAVTAQMTQANQKAEQVMELLKQFR